MRKSVRKTEIETDYPWLSKSTKIGASILCLLLGFVLAFSGCSYLHSPKETEIYNNSSKAETTSAEPTSTETEKGTEKETEKETEKDSDIITSERKKDEPDVYVVGDLSIHFLELGNAYTGDCTYIKAGDTDILIDAGSKRSSIETIVSYIDKYVTDNTLEYVIITHAHEDHYAGFAVPETEQSIFDRYVCNTIIDFALTNQKETAKMYSYYQRELADEIAAGATHYTAAEVMQSGKNVFDLGNGMELEILDSYYYYNTSSSENDYSVCCQINQDGRHFLFTGDLEAKGERKLVEMNETLGKVELYKAGHHGSKTSTTTDLLEVIQPEVVCVCCCAGSAEYTIAPENQFPTQTFVDNVSRYTDRVYVTTLCLDWSTKVFTSMNGNITVTSGEGGVIVTGSNNDVKLKDTEWFIANRECPVRWQDEEGE